MTDFQCPFCHQPHALGNATPQWLPCGALLSNRGSAELLVFGPGYSERDGSTTIAINLASGNVHLAQWKDDGWDSLFYMTYTPGMDLEAWAQRIIKLGAFL